MTMNFYTATPLWAVMIVDNDFDHETVNVTDEGFEPQDQGCTVVICPTRQAADAKATEILTENEEESQRAIVVQFTPSHIMQWQSLVTTESCTPAARPAQPRAKSKKDPDPEPPRGRKLDLSDG